MLSGKLIERLEQLAPPGLALSWDNPGLICGRRDKEIKKVMIALDATEDVVEKAADAGCDFLLTHHPMIFKAVQKINTDTPLGRKLIRLISSDICCFAMHTNFDAAPGCMADLVCDKMGMQKEQPLIPSEAEEIPGAGKAGIGFIGILPEPVPVPELCRRIAEAFTLEGAVYYDTGKPVQRAAVCPGSGRGELLRAAELSADVLITGDMGHHDGIDALDMGMSLIDAGHFGLEHIFVKFMKDLLEREMPELELLTDETDYRHFM
ncbi:MAG: Nif3-like dinuclear metal center hexameric protein [Eubacteriales bacterium]|nr:Nif3-like dinuclear metal center hexameric protein [Eubacteriales bacterium]